MSSGAVLIVPASERGRGGGHLGRSLFLFKKLNALGREAYLWIPENLKDDVSSRFRDFFELDPCTAWRILSHRQELSDRLWDFVVLDNFRTSADDFAFWAGLGPIIGIDEGGPCRNSFDFLIDLLPSLSKHEPNLGAPGLLPLPKNRRSASGRSATGLSENVCGTNGPDKVPLRILISFGAEDSAGLGFSAARALVETALPFARGAAQASVPAPERTLVPRSSFPEITLIAPALNREQAEEAGRKLAGVKVIAALPDLKERLADYDLLITHFGLGAFEAVYARVPVLIVSPTAYHEKLAKSAGFLTMGRGADAQREKLCSSLTKHQVFCNRFSLPDILDHKFLLDLENRTREIARRFGLEDGQKEDLGSFVSGLSVHSPRCCPVCEADRPSPSPKHGQAKAAVPVLARFPEETYRRCPRCGVIYLGRLKAPPIEYEKDYFFSFYKKQYGKTYLEDFPNLMEMGRKRMVYIKQFLENTSRQDARTPGQSAIRKPGAFLRATNRRTGGSRFDVPPCEEFIGKPSLLDIGCAYGPFLAVAAESGFCPAGIDPAEDAVRYVNEELRFTAWHGFFPGALPAASAETSPSAEKSPARFDVITLWYVIEHFEEPGRMLCEIHRLLKDGGVLAFSTPSFSGISGRKSLSAFLKNSPPDHWTVWSPRSCGKILKQYGFRLCKIAVTGHHPERFPLLGRFLTPAKKCPLYRLLLLASRLFRLGDTFEAYAVKFAKIDVDPV